MTQLNVTLAFVALILLGILIALICIEKIDWSELLKKIRKRSWE